MEADDRLPGALVHIVEPKPADLLIVGLEVVTGEPRKALDWGPEHVQGER
jgi:hypothetical protein